MKKYLLYLIAAVGMTACTKVEDPFVDRVAAPVLLVFDNSIGDGGGLTTEPTVTSKISGNVSLSVRIYELDKTNMLSKPNGIDSLPVPSLALKLTTRTGTAIADITTDAKGKAILNKAWADFGVAAPKAGTTVSLTLSGKYKDQAFSKLLRLQGVN